MIEAIKQKDFPLEASEQKVKNFLDFSCTKTWTKEECRVSSSHPLKLLSIQLRELSRIFAEVFCIRHCSHPCRSLEHVSMFHIIKLPFSIIFNNDGVQKHTFPIRTISISNCAHSQLSTTNITCTLYAAAHVHSIAVFYIHYAFYGPLCEPQPTVIEE